MELMKFEWKKKLYMIYFVRFPNDRTHQNCWSTRATNFRPHISLRSVSRIFFFFLNDRPINYLSESRLIFFLSTTFNVPQFLGGFFLLRRCRRRVNLTWVQKSVYHWIREICDTTDISGANSADDAQRGCQRSGSSSIS